MPEYEKCKVYADGCKPPRLKYWREGIDKVHLLSVTKDFVDFSHFEYENHEKSLEPRRFKGGITICPLYVVFRKP